MDWIKWALRIAAVASIIGILLGVINLLVQLPTVSLDSIQSGLNLAYSILDHYIPGWAVLWPSILFMLTLDITLLTIRVSLSAQEFILKIWQ